MILTSWMRITSALDCPPVIFCPLTGQWSGSRCDFSNFSASLTYPLMQRKTIIPGLIMNCSNFKMRVRKIIVRRIFQTPVGAGTGLEPVTSGLWGRRAAICSIPPYGRRRRLPVGARRRIHVVLMMGCACLGLSRALHMALHSPFYMSYGVRHDAYGRRSCRLLHFIHLNTHTGLTAIAIHFASHPFLTITGHYPGGAILRRT